VNISGISVDAGEGEENIYRHHRDVGDGLKGDNRGRRQSRFRRGECALLARRVRVCIVQVYAADMAERDIGSAEGGAEGDVLFGAIALSSKGHWRVDMRREEDG
jgi:hypothetical protein